VNVLEHIITFTSIRTSIHTLLGIQILRANQQTITQLRKKGDVSKNSHSITLIPYDEFLRYFAEKQITPSPELLSYSRMDARDNFLGIPKRNPSPIPIFLPQTRTSNTPNFAPQEGKFSRNSSDLEIGNLLSSTPSDEWPISQISRGFSNGEWASLSVSSFEKRISKTSRNSTEDEMDLDDEGKFREDRSLSYSSQNYPGFEFPMIQSTNKSEPIEMKPYTSPSRNEQMRGKEWLKLILN
jgi:hypothetical protein